MIWSIQLLVCQTVPVAARRTCRRCSMAAYRSLMNSSASKRLMGTFSMPAMLDIVAAAAAGALGCNKGDKERAISEHHTDPGTDGEGKQQQNAKETHSEMLGQSLTDS